MITVWKDGTYRELTEANAAASASDPNWLCNIPATILADAVQASFDAQEALAPARLCFWCGEVHRFICPRVRILHVEPISGRINGYEFWPPSVLPPKEKP